MEKVTLVGEELIPSITHEEPDSKDHQLYTTRTTADYLNYRIGKSADLKGQKFKGSEAFIKSIKKNINVRDLISVDQIYCT